jgi:CBS domain-containing protein
MTMLEQLASTEIGDFMHESPVSVPSSAKLGDIVETMQGRFGAMLVADDGVLVGIFTERDLMDRVDLESPSWKDLPVSEKMTQKPRTLKPTSNLGEAITVMSQGHFRHVPVVDDDGKLVGIVSIRDVMRHAVERFPKEFLNLPSGPKSQASAPWGG